MIIPKHTQIPRVGLMQISHPKLIKITEETLNPRKNPVEFPF